MRKGVSTEKGGTPEKSKGTKKKEKKILREGGGPGEKKRERGLHPGIEGGSELRVMRKKLRDSASKKKGITTRESNRTWVPREKREG